MSGEGRRSHGEPACGDGSKGPSTATGRLPPPRPSSTLLAWVAGALFAGLTMQRAFRRWVTVTA
jgi:hypothetical protein